MDTIPIYEMQEFPMVRGKKSDSGASANPPVNESRESLSNASPLVFISHDHRDADLAEAFGNLLTDASGGVLQSFRSSDKKGTSGIEFGSEWYTKIMSKMGEATDVVALLTPHNLDRPWILYEAGVAKGKLNTTVLGIAVGIELENANSGPFAQFQNCGDDSDSLTKLVLQLIKRNPQAAPREEAVRRQVEAFAESAKQIKESRSGKGKPETPVDSTSVAKIFEEIKVLVRDLPVRLENQIQEGVSRKRSRKHRRFHPMMMEEIMHHPAFRERGLPPTVGLMMFASFLRDDYPWFFELVAELHRAFQRKDEGAIAIASETLRTTLDLFGRRGLFFEPRGPEDEEMYYFMRHLPEVIESFLPPVRAAREKKQTPKEG